MKIKHEDKKSWFCLLEQKLAWIILGLFLISGIIFASSPATRLAAFKFTKPKPIIASSSSLPETIQQAIRNLANREIKSEQANANLVINTSPQTSMGLASGLILNVQEVFTSNPSEKAKLEIKIIDNLIAKFQQENPDQLVKTIKEIGSKTDEIVKNPNSQSDRGVLQALIEQYNRLQLILQQIEDKLPMSNYLKVEDARQKYLVVTAMASINNAPNLDAVHNLAVKEVAKVVGDDFAELKAIEIISDFEAGVKPEAREKLSGLEKQLAVDFEKKMLKLPRDVRERKLQDFIKYSFGNPIRQIQSFNRMKDFLSDREMILGIDSLNELALKKLENKVFQIDSEDTLNLFLDSTLKNPKDIKVLTLLQLYVNSGKDEAKKKKLGDMQKSVQGKVAEFFNKAKEEELQNYFAPEASESADLLDVATLSNLEKITPRLKNIKEKTVKNFIETVSKSNFLTRPGTKYNVAPLNSDVRILLSSPAALKVLQDEKLDLALKAQAQIIGEHLLLQVNDPEIFENYQQFISDNPSVKQTLQSYLGQSFFSSLAKKKAVIDKLSKEEQQKLYEKMQAITQQIFVANDSQKSEQEKLLSEDIQKAIDQLKNNLPDNNVPKIETPEGVILPVVAKLPDEVENAIIAAAKKKIEAKKRPKEVELDLSIKAKDLGVSDPIILPGNPLYIFKRVLRNVALVAALDPVSRAQRLIDQDNEKTLEAAKLLASGQDIKTIDSALLILKEVQQDFERLKSHANEVNGKNIDTLVDKIIENGLARQTVLSAIEDKVYGDTYVEVEKIRSDILKDGVDTLLKLTDNNVPALTQKLEAAIENSAGSELKDIKAVELLTEIAKTQPEAVQETLDESINNIAQKLEDKLLAMPEAERVEKVLDYIDASPGNPIIQFEAADELKSHFDNPQTIALTEGIKDAAVENLTDLISEITDGGSKQEFVDIVVGDKPQDLKVITDIEIRITPPETQTIVETTPILEEVKEIKAEVEQNIIANLIDNPHELAGEILEPAGHVTDILDVKVAQEIEEVLTRSPEVAPEVAKEAQKLEIEVVNNFIESVSKEADQALTPVPDVIEQLVELKDQTPPSGDAKIDVAIKAEVDLIEEHLTNEVNDPQTFENYLAQIEENPVIEKVVTSVGGTKFTQALDQTAQEIQTAATSDQITLVEAVKQIEQEIFTAPVSQPSEVEQTLPQTVQAQIQEVKQEVPVEQVPQITVEAQVTVTAPAETPAPASQPVSAPPAEAPAPAAPTVPAL